MLRWSVLLLGLASSSCVLGDGIDLPSTHGPTDGGLTGEGSGSLEGSENAPPDAGAPSAPGTGGNPCCPEPNLGGGSGSGGEPQ